MEQIRQIDPVKILKEKFQEQFLDFLETSETRFYILIDKKDLLEIVDFVFNELKARYQIVTGMDTPQGIEIVYHFAFDRHGKVISLRVILPHDNPEVESISLIITGAQWIEREIIELLGVTFLHHPDPRKFLMSDDWPEGVYPLRRKK